MRSFRTSNRCVTSWGRIIDNAQFLDKVDPSIAHFVLFHEDIRTNNILVAYEDHTRVVGIIDWEGARVVPMWSCVNESQVAEPEFTTSEQYLPFAQVAKGDHDRHGAWIFSG